MDLNVIKNKAENVYGGENTTEYKEFEDKFKPKKMTDDCYTPDNIYETVADYVATRFKVDRNKFVRPFYPGGDYEKYNYMSDSIVAVSYTHLLPLVKTSKKFRDILNEKGFKAAEVNGESKERAEILNDFENNKYNVLCNSMLLTEGWDCPDVDCVVILRPTKDVYKRQIAQMVKKYNRHV